MHMDTFASDTPLPLKYDKILSIQDDIRAWAHSIPQSFFGIPVLSLSVSLTNADESLHRVAILMLQALAFLGNDRYHLWEPGRDYAVVRRRRPARRDQEHQPG